MDHVLALRYFFAKSKVQGLLQNLHFATVPDSSIFPLFPQQNLGKGGVLIQNHRLLIAVKALL